MLCVDGDQRLVRTYRTCPHRALWVPAYVRMSGTLASMVPWAAGTVLVVHSNMSVKRSERLPRIILVTFNTISFARKST